MIAYQVAAGGCITLTSPDRLYCVRKVGGSGCKDTKYNLKCTMRVGELLKINAEMMKLMSRFGVRMEDYEHVRLFEDYVDMVEQGEKKEYVYAVLGEKYGVAKRTMQRIMARMGKVL